MVAHQIFGLDEYTRRVNYNNLTSDIHLLVSGVSLALCEYEDRVEKCLPSLQGCTRHISVSHVSELTPWFKHSLFVVYPR